jgi:hypothetical protein
MKIFRRFRSEFMPLKVTSTPADSTIPKRKTLKLLRWIKKLEPMNVEP